MLTPDAIPFEEIVGYLDRQALFAGQWQMRKAKEPHGSTVCGWRLQLKKRAAKEGKPDAFDMQAGERALLVPPIGGEMWGDVGRYGERV